MNQNTMADATGDGNTRDEVNLDEVSLCVEDDGNAVPHEVNTDIEDEGNTDEGNDDEPTPDLPTEEPILEEVPPRANIPRTNDARNNLALRRGPIRYGIQDNPDRGSRNLPEPKHLVIKLPDALAQSFHGVWVTERGEEVFVDFFPRSDQNDRTGYKKGDAWRWIKIKDNGEIAMGISRPYTKSRTDGELVRDYRFGVFKLTIPLHAGAAPERAAEDQPAPNRPF